MGLQRVGHDERLRTHARTQKQPNREVQRTVFLFSPEDWILCIYLCSFLNLQPDGTYGIKKDKPVRKRRPWEETTVGCRRAVERCQSSFGSQKANGQDQLIWQTREI